MDYLSLRKYRRLPSPVDRDINPPKKLTRLRSKRRPAMDIDFIHNGPMQTEREFVEFYINDVPLSELLDTFYKTKGSILDNSIGLLGSFENKNSELIKVKQLLGKSISDKEIRQLYPEDWTDSEFQHYLWEMREELSDPEILIYGCPVCGDYECGGIAIKIDKTVDAFVWTIIDEDKRLTFEFDIYQYFDLFNRYIRELERKS
jgi:hypothetical protein